VTYTPTIWVDETGVGDGTIVTAARLNNIEQGIVTADGTPGPAGPTGPQGPSGQSAGKFYYFATSDPSDVAGYKTMLASPSAGPETTLATVCTGTGDILIAAFATEPGAPGAVDYPPGTAMRRIYAMVSSGTARLHLQVYKRDAAGAETLIRDEFSAPFTDTAVAPQEWSATSPAAGTLLATDRLVAKLYAQRVSGPANVTVTTFYEGTAHGSHVQTTISAGAQGPKGDPGGVSLVAALPSVPYDGQEVAFLADANNGVLWHLKYRTGSSSPYKWEWVGGSALFAEVVAGANTVNQTTYGDPAQPGGPNIALPLAGDYEVTIGMEADRPTVANGVTFMSYAIGVIAAVDADAIRLTQYDAPSPGPGANISRTRRKNGLGAVTLAAKYRTNVNYTSGFYSRWMRALPIRLGGS
jgi:hypothetical protein